MINHFLRLLLGVQFILLFGHNANAKKLTIRPGVSIQELYTDNISLAPSGQKKDAFVTQISPYVTLFGRGARNRFNAAFRIQNLFFHGIARDSKTFFQGQLQSRSRLWLNSFFVDLRGTHSQANTRNTGRVAIDNISRTGGRVEVTTYTVSPFWNIRLGGYAQGEARVSYSGVVINNNDDQQSNISDARIHEEKLSLNSSNRFDVFGWKLGMANRKEKRTASSSNDIRYFNTFGELNFRLMPRFMLFTRVGYADNDLGTNRLNSKNGIYYQGGARWRPSSGFKLSAAGGNNSFVNVSMVPFQRAKLDFGFRHNTIGLNTGSQWNANFLYRAANLVWRTNYTVDTVTTQRILLERDVFATGFNDLNTLSGLTVNNNFGGLPTLRNEVFVRKRGEISIQGTVSKSTLRLTGYIEKRNYEGLRQNGDVKGVNMFWRWRFDGRTSSLISTNVQQFDGGNIPPQSSQKNTRWSVAAQIDRAIMEYFTTTVGYQFTRQYANLSASEYIENRVFARINFVYR